MLLYILDGQTRGICDFWSVSDLTEEERFILPFLPIFNMLLSRLQYFSSVKIAWIFYWSESWTFTPFTQGKTCSYIFVLFWIENLIHLSWNVIIWRILIDDIILCSFLRNCLVLVPCLCLGVSFYYSNLLVY